MNDEIFFDGVRYVSAGQAASFLGVTRDYVARLCKEAKLAGRRVGREWYVSNDSLQSFLVDQEYTKARRREDLATTRRHEYRAQSGAHAVGKTVPYASVVASSAAHHQAAVSPAMRSPDAIQGETYAHQALARAMKAEAHNIVSSEPLAVAAGNLRVPIHALAPSMDILHKLVALVVAVLFTAGTYAFIDAEYARITLRDTPSVASSIVESARVQLAAVAENPPRAFTDMFARLARAVNARVNTLVYSIAFPESLVPRYSGNASGGAVSVRVSAGKPLATSPAPASPANAVKNTASRSGGTISSGIAANRVIEPPSAQGSGGAQRVIVIERAVPAEALAKAGGISEEILNARLEQLDNKLMGLILGVSSSAGPVTYVSTPPASGGITNNIALTNRIDQLSDVAFSGGTITGTAISGGTITDTAVSATTLSASGATGLATTTVTGDLTVTGAVNFTGTPLTATNATFTNATSTTLYTTTLGAVTASTTNLTFATAVGGNATTTNLFSTTASSTNLYSTNGNIGVLSAGTLALSSTLNVSGLSTFAGFISTASSTIGDGTQAGGLTVSGGATTTGNAYFGGTLGVGASSIDASAVLQIDSTTKGFLGPRLTTAQKTAIASPAAGLTLYDSTLNKLNVYNGSAWKNVGSTEVGGEVTSGTAGSVLFVDQGASTPVLEQDNAYFSYASSTHRLLVLQASTTRLSVFDRAYFGGSATTTIDSTGAITVTSNTKNTFPYASSTALSVSGNAYFAGSGIWNASGNVGLGTTNPLSVFDMYKTGSGADSKGATFRDNVTPTYAGNADNLLTVRGTGSSATTWRGRITAGGDNVSFLMGEYNSQAWLGAHNAALNAWASFYINPEPDPSVKVFIGAYVTRANSILTVDNGTGNVGIGTTTPWGKLSVTGAGTGTGVNFLLANSANTPIFKVLDNGSITATGAFTSSATTANTFPYASSTALTVSGTGYFGTASTTALTVSSLTANRVPYVTTAGAFTDSANLTFDGSTLTAANLTSSGNVSLANATTTNFFSTTASSTNLYSQAASVGTLAASGASTFSSTLGVTGLSTFAGFLSTASSTITSGLFSMNGGASTTNFTTSGIGYFGTATSTTANANTANIGTLNAGTLSLVSTLDVSGLATFGAGFVSQASSTVAGNFTTTGTNAFTGASNFTGLGTFANGFVSQASSTVNGAFTATGAVALGSTLNVTGNTTLANATSTNLFSTTASSTNLYSQAASVGTLAASGASTFSSTLGVTGLSTFAGFLSTASSTITSGLFSMNGGASTTNFTNSGNTWLTGITSALLGTDQNGKVVATSSIGTNLLTGALGTVNGTSLSAGGSITISAASSTLLANNNTWSGLNVFGNATSTLFTSTTAWVDTLNLTNDLSVANGGTGASTLTGLLQGNGTSAFTALTDSSTVGQVLRVTGASTYAWGALDLSDTDAITGDLPFANLAQVSANSILGNITGSTGDAASIATSSLFVWNGTGDVVRTTNAALVTPALGTPTALVGTNITGTAASLTAGAATVLATARNINGTSFNGSADITITAASSTLLANNNTFSGSNIFSSPLSLTAVTGTTTIASGQGFTIGTSQFVVQQGSGNVGIGTAAPGQKLDVTGNANVTGYINVPTIYASDANATFTIGKNYRTIIQANNSNTILFDGGVNQETYLRGYGNSGVTIDDTNKGTTFGGNIQLAGSIQNYNGGYGALALNPNGGNVGIGTTTPWGRLSVTGAGTGTGVNFLLADSNNSPIFKVLDDGTATLTGGLTASALSAFSGGLTSYASSTIGDGTQTGGLTISGGATTTGNAYFAGNVGIGTSSPNAPFTVSGSNPTNTYTNAVGVGRNPLSLNTAIFSTTGGTPVSHLYSTQVTYTSNDAGNIIGFESDIVDPATVTANIGAMFGITGTAKHFGSGTVSTLSGGTLIGSNASASTVTTVLGTANDAQNITAVGATTTTAIATQSRVTNNSAYGLVTNGYASRSLISNNNANATMTNAYGVAFDSFTNTGTITNTYGMYVGDITTGTQTNTPYSFYAADAGALNYFAGGTLIAASSTIGNGTQAGGLTISGGATTTGNAYFAGNVGIVGDTILNQSKKLYLAGTAGGTADANWYMGVDASYNTIIGGAGSGSREFRLTDVSSGNIPRFTVNWLSGLATLTGGFLSNASSTITSGLFSMNGGASTTNITASGTGYFGLGQFTNTSGTTTIASGQGFTIGDSQFVLQQGSGRVGIGTAAPGETLQIGQSGGGVGDRKAIKFGNDGQAAPSAGNAASDGDKILIYQGSGYKDAIGLGATSEVWFQNTNTSSTDKAFSFYAGTANGVAPTEKLTVLTNGNVGIGTTSPWKMLSVAGDAILTNLTATGTVAITGTSGTTTIAAGQGFTIGTSQFVLQQGSGSVGIGTASPLTSLDVRGSALDSIGFGSASAQYGILSYNSGAPTTAILKGTTGNALSLGANGSAGTIFINTSGFVGIGTTTATAPLQVNVSGATGYGLMLDATSFGSGRQWVLGDGMTTNGTFELRDLTANAARLNITSIGNVGIGDTTPSYALDVTGAGHFTTFVDAANFVATSSSVASSIAYRLGINNTSPSYPLDVNGFINVDGTAGGYKQAGNTILYASTTQQSVYVGPNAGAGLTAGNAGVNLAVGMGALQYATTSAVANNVAIGPYAMQGAANNGTNSGRNTALGAYALNVLTTGNQNTAGGYNSLGSEKTGTNNTGFGYNVLAANTVDGNSAFGSGALSANSTGIFLSAFGASALTANTTGSYNNAFGGNSQLAMITGSHNVTFGTQTLANATSSSGNVVIGSNAGSGISGATGAGGNYNTLLGYQTGYGLTTGSQNIFLGSYQTTANANITTGSNNIIIGNDVQAPSATASNQLNIGNLIFGTGLSGTGTTIAGNIGIGTTTPWGKLSVTGAGTGTGINFLLANSANTPIFKVLDDGTATLTGSLTASALSAFSGGLTSYASSTIGDGTQAGGLTISGGATTTGNAYFAGNVGIGIQPTTNALRVVGGSAAQALLSGYSSITAENSINNGELLIGGTANWQGKFSYEGSTGGDLYIDNTFDNSNGDIFFRTKTAGTPVNALTIKGSGNVGIGTTTPQSLLSVNSDVGTQVGVWTTSASTFNPSLFLGNARAPTTQGTQVTYVNATGETAFNNVYTGGTAAFRFQKGAYGSGTELMTLLTNGNVGIGTTTPWGKLAIALNNGEANTVAFNIASSTATATTSLFTVLNTGKVGVGIAAPTANLHVAGRAGKITGTVTSSGTAVTGASTLFTTEVQVGDTLQVGLLTATVASVESNTALTLSAGFSHDVIAAANASINPTSNLGIFAMAGGTSALKISSNQGLTLQGDNTTAVIDTTNLLANGTFATNDFTSWTAGSYWSAATGAAVHTASTTAAILNAASVRVVNDGRGYTVGDVLTLPGGDGNATITVTAVTDGYQGTGEYGNVSTFTLSNAGTGYTDAITGTATGGTGTGFTFAITRVTAGDTLVQTASPAMISGESYRLTFVVSGSTQGLLTISLGGTTVASGLKLDAGTQTFVFQATGNTALTITPTADYNGTLDTFTLTHFENTSSPLLTFNNAAGTAALEMRTQGTTNTFAGLSAGKRLVSGANNTGFGLNALSFNTTGASNSAFGSGALTKNTTGGTNTAFGLNALTANTTGAANNAFGASALAANTTGNYNVALGASALAANTTGSSNFGLGLNSLAANTTGSSNTAIGTSALAANTTGTYNVALGSSVLGANTTGYNNIGIGAWSLTANQNGTNNIAIGYNALYYTNGASENVGIGYSALGNNTTGASNTAIGSGASGSNYAATGTVAIGYNAGSGGALFGNQGSVSIGYYAGRNFLTGSDYNTLLGYQSGYNVTTGQYNVQLGYRSATGGVTTGSNNVLIGKDVRNGLTATGDNQLNIGNLIFATGLGSGDTLSTGNVGIGTTTPATGLEITNSSSYQHLRLSGAQAPAMTFFTSSTDAAARNFGIVTNQQAFGDLHIFQSGSNTAHPITGGGATAVLSIGATGNVGIGTTSPSRLLSVSDDGTYSAYFSGRVGIGTNSPGVALDVQAALSRLQLKSTTGTNETYMQFSNTGGVGYVGQDNSTGAAFFGSPYGLALVAAGTNPIQLGHGTTPNVTILNSGNVGIGTTTPGTRLHVVSSATNVAGLTVTGGSSVYTSAPSASSGQIILGDVDAVKGKISYDRDNGDFYFDNTYSGAFYFRKGTSGTPFNAMTIDTTGRVGFGTASPGAPMDMKTVDAGVGNRTLIGIFGRTGAATIGTERAAGFAFSDANNPTLTAGIAGVRLDSNSDYNGALAFYVHNGGASDATTLTEMTEAMRINNLGNVGIGTTTPSNLLTLFSSTASVAGFSGGATKGVWSMGYDVTNNRFAIASSSDITTNVRMVIDNNGNVGIGTTSPTTILSVAGGSNVTPFTIDSTGTATNLRFTNSGAVKGYFGYGTAGDGGLNTYASDGSTQTLLITDAGNVGIGTSTPRNVGSGVQADANQKMLTVGSDTVGVMQIAGGTDARFIMTDYSGTSGNKVLRMRNDAGNFYLEKINDAYTAIDSTPFTINTTGNVGIGTTTPWSYADADNLTIGTASGSNGLTIAGATRSNIFFSDGASQYAGILSYNHGDDSLQLTVGGGGYNDTKGINITSTGNVGIGTSTPGSKLQVVGNIQLGYADDGNVSRTIQTADSATNSVIKPGDLTIRGGNSVGSTGRGGGNLYLQGGSGFTADAPPYGQVIVQAGLNNFTGLYSPLTLQASGGNVGIGTTTPGYKLDVYGSARFGANPTNNLIAGSDSGQRAFVGSQTSGWGFGLTSDGGTTFPMTFDGSQDFNFNSGDVYFQNSTGNVGIGTTSPWRTLSVTGTVGFDGLTAGAGAGALCLTANKEVVYNSGSSACSVSSERFKTDIDSSSAGLAEVLQLRSVSFRYKQGFGDNGANVQIGLIAEEVAAVDPRLVLFDASSTPYSVKYENLGSVLVKAMQEQQAEFDALTGSTTLTASNSPQAQNFASAFFSNLFAKVTAWLADVGNGIGDVFAKAFHAKDQICIGETCVNEEQLKALLAAQNGSMTASAAGGDSSAAGGGVSSGAPVISINGNNPATLVVGAVYADLGASITGPTTADTNFGIRYFVDGVAMSEVQLDTSVAGEHTVDYVAENTAGTATSTRTVNVVNPSAGGDSSTGGVSSGTTSESTATSTSDTATSTAVVEPDSTTTAQSTDAATTSATGEDSTSDNLGTGALGTGTPEVAPEATPAQTETL